MDGFHIIQHFFTRMTCHFCSSHLEPEGVELVRQDQGVYIVNVHCTQCDRQMGIALVGMEGAEVSVRTHREYEDPELTPDELSRLAKFDPIEYDDVIEAHRFFSQLGSDWQRHLPLEMPLSDIVLEPEYEAS